MTKISPTRELVTLIKRVNAFGPRGLSGGALLDLGDLTSPAIYAPDSQHTATLSGMLIEHWDEHYVMVAVKICVIVTPVSLLSSIHARIL